MNGNDIMSDIIVHNKYARHIGDRRETWEDIAVRTATMHAKKYPELESEVWEVFSKMVLPKKVVPSMRSLQFSGKPIDLAPNRMYNCAFVAMDDYHAFSETMFLLLGGSGVGYSVQRRHTDCLPTIQPPHKSARYVIQDSIIGWSDAIKRLMKAYFFGEKRPIFDTRDIRQKGERLITSGGQAPGPEPLENALYKIEQILKKKKYGEKLEPIDVFDIQCHIAEAVLSGGIRRSATICLFDKNDSDMLSSKTSDWWVLNPQRAMANISAVLHRGETTKEEFLHIFKMIKSGGAGEPGFSWTNDYDLGFNPCHEISIQSMGFCNLTEVNGSNITNIEDLYERVRAATFIATLQAGYTDFFYLRPEWKKNAEEEALLGVSITGIASMAGATAEELQEASKIVIEENKRVAKIIGIREAKRSTCVKPSGTTSLVLGTSSGIHAWYAPFYARRIRLTKTEALYAYLEKEIPELLEDDNMRPHDTAVLIVPMKAPKGAIMRSETALETLERVYFYNRYWVEGGHKEGLNKHNVSCTINIKPDEWSDVAESMWKNRDNYSGISVLPYDNGTYEQAPFEEIDEEEYEKLSELVKEIDLTQVKELEDVTNLSGEIACGGGGCEIR